MSHGRLLVQKASKELADSPIFTGLKANKFLPEQAIPKSLDEYEKTLDELQEKLTAKGLKTKKHRELNVEIEQVKFDIKHCFVFCWGQRQGLCLVLSRHP